MDVNRYKNTAYTSLTSENASRGTIILLDGLPSDPREKEGVMSDLHERGYNVFFPRYEGSWESSGAFLDRSPVESITEFVGHVHAGQKIFLLAASFGGGIALSMANSAEIHKICALSPVISFRRARGIETLEAYLTKEYSRTYRYKPDAWQRLVRDELYCPLNERVEHPEKILIIAGSNDGQIMIADVETYARASGIQLHVVPGGHITLSKLDSALLDSIDAFFTAAIR